MPLSKEEPVSRLFEALQGAADGAFVVDEELRIHFWNQAAEEDLGFNQWEVVRQLCYRVLQGHGEGGNLICRECCQIAEQVLEDRPVNHYDIRARTKLGERRWLNMTVFTYKMREQGDRKFIVHMFRDITQNKDEARFFRRVLEAARRYHDIPGEREVDSGSIPASEVLTPREREVLTLLTRGHGTRDIADLLSISANTVRNHVQHILQKLQVHSRLEAVTYAIKHDLID